MSPQNVDERFLRLMLFAGCDWVTSPPEQGNTEVVLPIYRRKSRNLRKMP